MFTLNAGDTISGVSNIAGDVSITLMGQVIDAASAISGSTTENYLILAQLIVPATLTDGNIYTVPAGKTVNIKTIKVVNADGALTPTFQLFAKGIGLQNEITNVVTLQANGMCVYEDGKGWTAYNGSMQTMQSIYASTQQKFNNFRLAGHQAESIDRMLCNESNNAPATTGVLAMQAIWLTAGMVLNSIWLHSATTAAGTPTNYMAGIYDSNRNLLANSANLLTAAWAAQTLKQFNLTAAFTVPADGLYYIGYFMTATTMVTLKGNTAKTGGQLSGAAPILHGTSNTGLTTALPATANALSITTTTFWASVS